MAKAKGTWIWCNQEEFDIYLVAQNGVVVRIADTDNAFIIILIDMKKLATSINAWL